MRPTRAWRRGAVGAALLAGTAVLLRRTRRLKQAAHLAEEQAEPVRRPGELDAMKAEFLGTVQHELRNPLTAILGLADLLEMCWETWDDPAKLDAVQDIQVAARRLHDIVEKIIDLSTLDGENLGLNPEALRLRASVDKALASVGERYKGGIEVAVEVDVAADVRVYADPERLDQVLRALIDNAVKFSQSEGSVSIRAQARDGGQVSIEIADRGIGIPGADLKRVFERFYRVDNPATRRRGGTGMGLAVVRRLVSAHGARIDISSRPNEGTVVSLEWPASAAAAGGEAMRVAAERGEVRVRPGPSPGPAVPVQ